MDCVKQERMTKCYEDGLELYKNDKSMWAVRKYKEIARNRILPRKSLDFPEREICASTGLQTDMDFYAWKMCCKGRE